MTKDRAIRLIYAFHKDLVFYVIKNALTQSQKDHPEDVVQDFYLKLLESESFSPDRFITEGTPNKKYIFNTLHSIIVDEYKKAKIKTERINENKDYTEEKQPPKRDTYTWLKKVENATNNLYWFDKKLLNIYLYEIPSMRKISEETSISVDTIFKTIKKSKIIIKERLYNEYKETT